MTAQERINRVVKILTEDRNTCFELAEYYKAKGDKIAHTEYMTAGVDFDMVISLLTDDEQLELTEEIHNRYK